MGRFWRRSPRAESDAPIDTGVAWSRATGGTPNPAYPDQHSTTGTTVNQLFVGRVAGEDVGSFGETGAEVRAAAAAATAERTKKRTVEQ